MIEVRTVRPGELADVARVGNTDEEAVRKFVEQVEARLDDGTTGPEWIFVAMRDGRPLARAGFFVDEAPPSDPTEMYLFGLALDWANDDARQAARTLLDRARAIVSAVGPPIDARINPEVHSDHEERRQLLARAGFGLFQEKAGYYWQSGVGPPARRSDRLTFHTLAEMGADRFVDVLARGPAATLDRNDRYYYALTGPRQWATIMLGFLGAGDEATWKIGFDAEGSPVGYVMLSAFDEDATGTIAHVGVVPEHRGRRYIDDLLAEATADAPSRGMRAILSDVDTLNLAMRAAMERAGHRPGVRPWHVWHYRHPAP